MKKITQKRWEIAQKDEKNFWDKDWKKSIKEDVNTLTEYWNYHKKILSNFIKISKEKNILEIGGGASPLINYLPKAKKYSLDPLMDYFIKNFKLPKGIRYIKGKGEELPFKDNYFDLVIITNVIDHVHNYKEVLSEIKRVLKESGIVYLSLDCHNFMLKIYRDVREKLGVGDQAHPNTFTLEGIKDEFRDSGFKIIHLQEGNGDQGAYMSKNKSEIPFFQKIKISLREGGIGRLLNSIVYRVLNKIGEFISPEKAGVDFIFILKKSN
ncbi:MAG: class I SAM-dependent methyltransferase [Candidatus Pacearchaeota archaeon]|nr:class I SAM-dependent methyltransferase [Candidatus Pacearchaeota archaeon]